MSRIFEVISAFMRDCFEADDWDEDDDGDRSMTFRLEDDAGHEWDCDVLVEDDDDRLVFYSTMPEPVPQERRAAVMEFITRANYALPVGNFELDLEDGEICFKTSLDLEDVDPTEPMCRNLVDTNLTFTGLYYEALHSVIRGEAEPLEAISTVEELDDEDDEDDED